MLGAEAYAIDYLIVEGDRDKDGVDNSKDIFPDNPRGQTDTDSDGVGDEWELLYFESLKPVTEISDFDANGITDMSAFINNTAIHDVNFEFESGRLPKGWKNTGSVNWVVSDTRAKNGQRALMVEKQLAPGESAVLELPLHVHAGRMRFSSYKIIDDALNDKGYHFPLSVQGKRGTQLGLVYAAANEWRGESIRIPAGKTPLKFVYTNSSPTYKSPVVYLDSFSGLVGITPVDRDGDGVRNNDDVYPDRSDAATDDDDDGIADEWEFRYFYELDKADSTTDFDEDGLSDVEEFILDANPRSTDSDGDRVSDSKDKYPGDRRYQTDADNDGLADEWEIEILV